MSNIKTAPNLLTVVPSGSSVISNAKEVSVLSDGGVVTIKTSDTNTISLPDGKSVSFSTEGDSAYQDITIECDADATAQVIWQN